MQRASDWPEPKISSAELLELTDLPYSLSAYHRGLCDDGTIDIYHTLSSDRDDRMWGFLVVIRESQAKKWCVAKTVEAAAKMVSRYLAVNFPT